MKRKKRVGVIDGYGPSGGRAGASRAQAPACPGNQDDRAPWWCVGLEDRPARRPSSLHGARCGSRTAQTRSVVGRKICRPCSRSGPRQRDEGSPRETWCRI